MPTAEATAEPATAARPALLLRLSALALAVAAAAPCAAADAAPSGPPPASAAESAPSHQQPAPMSVHWDYLPRVGYLGDGLWFSLRVPHGTAAGWHASAGDHALAASVGNDGDTVDLHLPLTGSIPGTVEFACASERRTVRLVQPGGGAALALDGDGRLACASDAAVLVVDRTEADNDRRWSGLRHFGSEEALRCSLTIECPPVRDGDSALLAGIAGDQTMAVKGQNVLLLVPGADCLASWKHREFRQALAWMVSDLHCRGATHVVLAPPLVPPLEGELATPLADEMLDVAHAYHCRTVDLGALASERYWLLAPGVQGSTLNAEGRAKLADLLAPWR